MELKWGYVRHCSIAKAFYAFALVSFDYIYALKLRLLFDQTLFDKKNRSNLVIVFTLET